ncbi:MAG: methyl-accepting chemotaxis protein [Nitrospinota bacterium]|nr:methyl-accepting chemotaxis protein [Nitrospinota bacterium]
MNSFSKWYKNAKLGTKLLAAFLTVGLLPFSIMGYIALEKSSAALEKNAFNQLKAVREIKKTQIEQFFAERQGDIGVLTLTVNTLRDRAFQRLEAVHSIKVDQIREFLRANKLDNRNLFKYPETLAGINKIMQKRDGMGKTGETYLVGPDKLMRSDSFLDPVNHSVRASFANPEKGKVDTEAVRRGLAGESGSDVIVDYNGNPVLSIFSPLNVNGERWIVIAEMDVAEAFSPVDEEGKEFYAEYVKMYGYYDMFLIDPSGYVFYSASREPDYQTNMVNGKYASSNLGKLTRKVLETRQFALADFEPYEPSNGEPASFIAIPLVHKKDNEIEVIIALQLSLEAINKIMKQREGMGETGETYLVGSDLLMRSDSFLDPVNHTVSASFANPAKGKVDTEAAREAVAGNTDAKIIIDYNGNPVLSAYTPVKVGSTTWGLLAEIDESEAFSAINALKTLMAIIAIIGVASIIAVALVIARSISNPVIKAVEVLNELGKGNLNVSVETDREDEIGQMLSAVDKFSSDLSSVIREINMAAEQVNTGSAQVSDSSQSLSQGATESAASLEEITSSLTQIGSQTKLNAENASQANSLSTQAREMAEGGNKQMEEMVSAVTEINESSKNISKIIKAIDEIAFQTNLLALNAAVEAARAGRHGKGFAVVAEEVRNLAARSAKAAEETAELIEGSVKKAENGTAMAHRTSESLAEIVSGVTKVTDLVAEIAGASNEQAQGISQVNQALGQIDQVTQQNTANAEESAAAAEELAGQAINLKKMLARFTLKAENGRRSLPAYNHPNEKGMDRESNHKRNSRNVVISHSAPVKSGNGKGFHPGVKEKVRSTGNGKKENLVIALTDEEFGKF